MSTRRHFLASCLTAGTLALAPTRTRAASSLPRILRIDVKGKASPVREFPYYHLVEFTFSLSGKALEVASNTRRPFELLFPSKLHTIDPYPASLHMKVTFKATRREGGPSFSSEFTVVPMPYNVPPRPMKFTDPTTQKEIVTFNYAASFVDTMERTPPQWVTTVTLALS